MVTLVVVGGRLAHVLLVLLLEFSQFFACSGQATDNGNVWLFPMLVHYCVKIWHT
jgi:hypothetical protein